MIKVLFWDRSFVFVQDEAKPALEAAMGTSKKFNLRHLDGTDVLIGSSIARLTSAEYREYYHKLPSSDLRIEAPKKPELTDEQLEARRVRIKEMKAEFLAERNRKEANHGN